MTVGLDDFFEHQPQFTLRKGDHTAAVRMDAMKNQTALDNCFIELKSILDENELRHKPVQIYSLQMSQELQLLQLKTLY